MPEGVGPAAVPPPEGFVRVRMSVAYDGTPFHGFARNPDVVTVQSELEDTLAQVLRHPVTVTGAGRTDAGVHARGQVVSFDADESHFEPSALSRAMNRMLGPTIAVDNIEAAPPTFDARFSCTGRSYRYHVFNRSVIDPLTRHFTWHVRDRLDTDAMQRASEEIVGTHDFTSFSKRNKSRPEQTFVRTVREARWRRSAEAVSKDIVFFEITAGAFTHQMVRSLVGLCVEIGRGRRRVEDMGEVLGALSRDAAPSPAPSRGLVLWRAHYD
ncbi:MAG: tRNA pseudouridine(38-40) synthase TruA [Acidimicrobiaceae bacterium]|nr:tRNA pseudouridine(38-40) synthase TruA [Acidimicrobiaceae bacterium]MXW62710.1 tRNA pseudouridine(38-40) synthase TruA [Acidimicrobiaceae bacterium]MXW76718.1 tRNA pseudouridine(38-40) synthase TruA [Acidimicrobiaceae bacterium]MYA74368.1 tRNA pseudouridine(38-40) synthase TruA [Acidimicrobiaceae bacterium]MYC41875.1 tRNA pseudouridine(38-40) synthase TruA [Acidimicrobiaceae bacterium]